MECFVLLPNSTWIATEVNSKGRGQECMDKVCEHLGIIEQDYFGLTYKTNRGETLWLNLRNRIDRQLIGQPHRLQLRVKFFVPPHRLVFTETRNQFYEQVRQNLEIKKLVLEKDNEAEDVIALMVQVEHGSHDAQTHQLNIYKQLYMKIMDREPSQEMIEGIVDKHIALGDMSKASSQYSILQTVSKLPGYGVEYHEVMFETESIIMGVGPEGVMLHSSEPEAVERIQFQRITKAEHTGRNCVLRVLNDNASEVDIVLRHSTLSGANALYRCVTEMHSFFFCSTVHDEVSMQFSRDFKGTIASLFNEHSTLGRDYVFDIKRTSQEALEFARRQMFKNQMTHDVRFEQKLSSHEAVKSKAKLQPAEERCKVLEEALKDVVETLTCCVCVDSEINTTLVPCGHLFCAECASRLLECPLCRKQVMAKQRIYYPTCRDDTDMRSVSLKVVSSPDRHQSYKKRRKRDLNTSVEP